MTTQHQITLPEPDCHTLWEGAAYKPDTVRRLIAEAIEASKAKLLEGVGEPVAKYWAHPTGRTRITVQGSVINADATWQVTHLLYTADQLAAAVSKERAKWENVK